MSTENEIPTDTPFAIEFSKLTDDEVHAFTRHVRVKAVGDVLTSCQGKAPSETGDRIFLTNMLNGLDSQANASKRLVADKNAADSSSAMISAVLDGINKLTAFTSTDPNLKDINPAPERAMLGNEFQTPAIVPGELDVVTPQLDYSSFMISQGKDPDSLGSQANAPVEEDEF